MNLIRKELPMTVTDRLDEEIAFHDRQAHQRSASFRRADDLHFRDEDYLDHESWIRPHGPSRSAGRAACSRFRLRSRHGRRGDGPARAMVTAFDLSAGYLVEAGRRTLANGVDVDLVQADGERLPFANGRFDRVWGNAVLHHLDLSRTASEIYRVLRPGGIAVFCEPWGENPLLDSARRRLPYSGQAAYPRRTPPPGRRSAGSLDGLSRDGSGRSSTFLDGPARARKRVVQPGIGVV